MKIWIFSVVVHLLLLWALSLVLIPAPKQQAASAVIQTYSYTQAHLKTEPAAMAEQVVSVSKPFEFKPPAKKQDSKKTRSSEATAAIETTSETTSAVMNNSATDRVEAKPFEAAGSLSLAQRALAAASAAVSGPMTDRKQQREVVFKSSTPTNSELASAMLQKVKTYADGSELVKGVHGCWKVPPAESRKGATWMMTSTPCEPDTTVEQINDILQNRRTYADH